MIDETDDSILKILMHDARTPFLNIAKKLKVSEGTVRKRVKDMEKSGVIKKYGTVINPSKVGYGCVAIIGIDARPDKFLDIAEKLSRLDNTKFVSTSSGDHMIMIEVWMEDANGLRNFISEKIEKMEGVTRTCPAILMERLKE